MKTIEHSPLAATMPAEAPQKSDSMLGGGFSLVHTVFDVSCELPIQICENLRIQRPSAHQLDLLGNINGDSTRFGLPQVDFSRFVQEQMELLNENGSSFPLTALPDDKHRFLVMAYSGSNLQPYKFEFIAALATPPLEFVLQVGTSLPFGEGERTHWGASGATHNMQLMPIWQTHALNEKYASELKFLWKRSEELEQKFPWISTAARMLWDLRTVPCGHLLYILGLFAVIELALTHDPKDRENGDSLTHQVSTKVPLLTARMEAPPSRTNFQHGLSEQKLWKKLYALRSTIAHGGKPDFESANFRSLKRSDFATDYIHEVARKILVQSLIEPTLVESLKQV